MDDPNMKFKSGMVGEQTMNRRKTNKDGNEGEEEDDGN